MDGEVWGVVSITITEVLVTIEGEDVHELATNRKRHLIQQTNIRETSSIAITINYQ